MRNSDWQIRKLRLIFRLTFDHNFLMQQVPGLQSCNQKQAR